MSRLITGDRGLDPNKALADSANARLVSPEYNDPGEEMALVFRLALAALAILILIIAGFWLALPGANDRQTRGTLTLASLSEPVRIVRDDFGVPYIYAETLQDAVRAQGFVSGQDRLFQMEAAKRAATGRLSEVFGAGDNDVILNLDREARVIGFRRLAERQYARLSESSKADLVAYLEGLNAYIETRSSTHPLAFQLAGFKPEPWTEIDILSVVYYLGWASSANFDAELIAQQVIDTIGVDRFEEIAPIVINPDDDPAMASTSSSQAMRSTRPLGQLASWTQGGVRQHGMGGSNNWAFSGAKVGEPAAIVTNDPHLDSRSLPGPWHPVALITPELRVVGVSMSLPGIVVGRNEHIAFGVTNAYADAVDLYIETIDPENPDHYLEGETSIAFDIVREQIRVKTNESETGFVDHVLEIRYTRRGPVITDHAPDNAPGHVVSMRWASADYMGEHLGLDGLMRARTIEDALTSVGQTRVISLNFVIGDVTGRIARRVSGAAPIRLRGDGMTPFEIVDGEDNWAGPIPAEDMPGEIDPERGWTGTANHMTAPADYPYVYTTFASASYRYRRMQDLFDRPRLSAEDGWQAQYDTYNLFAEEFAPIFAVSLSASEDDALVEVGAILEDWDFHDVKSALAPTLFHETVRQLAMAIFEDELGPDASKAYLSNWYVWQERFDAMVQSGQSDWFDDTRTAEIETLDMLIERAAHAALDRLTRDHGSNRNNWLWGEVHKTEFQGPLRQTGLVGQLTGNRDVPVSGSGETLLRALYPFDNPFNSQWHASLRMTADLNDPDKVRAILPGGVVGRTFSRHLSDQTDYWADETAQTYWWFSDAAIEDNQVSELILTPSE